MAKHKVIVEVNGMRALLKFFRGKIWGFVCGQWCHLLGMVMVMLESSAKKILMIRSSDPSGHGEEKSE